MYQLLVKKADGKKLGLLLSQIAGNAKENFFGHFVLQSVRYSNQ